MNQQQLQTARAALWHQTAPLETADEATTWLEDLGLCLFLPRHAQLPAPAPSFVEAVHGKASAAPPAPALERATELAARLVDERKAVPLNLLGTYSEQPDFLIAPEVLPWVAAVRGDRQWNAAPGGRTSPLVARTWQVLDREGEATAVELREALGRELTEAAVLRALIELWTTVRAVPVAAQGGPTRWTLLKNRFPAQLATGGNTAQGMALSALLSIYLWSAVAATAEEAEIMLSPLTARSRIREVIHGMTAARQFGSMSVGSQTLLFVEGSLPEHLPVEEASAAAEPAAAEPVKRTERPPFRKEFRKDFREKRGPSGQPDASGRQPRPPFHKRTDDRSGAKPWQKRMTSRGPERPVREERGAGAPQSGDRGERRFESSGERRAGAKPWQKRPGFRGPERPLRERGAGAPQGGDRGERRFEPRGEKRAGAKPWQKRPGFREPERPGRERGSAPPRGGDRGEKRFDPQRRAGAKPWQKRPDAESGKPRDERPRFEREAGERRPRFEGAQRSERKPGPKFGQRPAAKFGARSGPKFGAKPGPRFGPKSGPKFGRREGSRPFGAKEFGQKKPGAKPFGGPRAKFPSRREEGGAAAGGRAPGPDRRPRFGKPQRREGSVRPAGQGKTFKGPPRKNFRKDNSGERNPRKNRSQEENPE